MQITKNIFFISNDETNISYKNFKLSPPQSRPLVILLTWLTAVDKHIYKYASFYLRYGFDILNIQICLWQLLWPVKGAQVLAYDVLKFLENNRSRIVVHGFSVGSYLWGEVLGLIEADRSRYQFVIDNIVGQIWDSPADITRIPTGVSHALFPQNKFLQNALKFYAIYHLRTFEDSATSHYIKSRNMMYDNIIRTPVLVLASEKDHISTEDTIRSICDYWEKSGIKVYLKLWKDSPHVGHMLKYPKEYIQELLGYLENIHLIDNNKLKANL